MSVHGHKVGDVVRVVSRDPELILNGGSETSGPPMHAVCGVLACDGGDNTIELDWLGRWWVKPDAVQRWPLMATQVQLAMSHGKAHLLRAAVTR